MANSPLHLPDDSQAILTLRFRHGNTVVAAPDGGTVSSSDPNVATAEMYQGKADRIRVVPVADGTCQVTYTNTGATSGGQALNLNATLDVTVGPPVPSDIEFDTENVIFEDKAYQP